MISPESLDNFAPIPEKKTEKKEETTEQIYEYADTVLGSLGELEKIEANRFNPEKDPFHNPEHIKNVVESQTEFFSAVSALRGESPELEKQRLEAITAAYGHDLVINYQKINNPNSFNNGMRARFRGYNPEDIPDEVKSQATVGNEKASAEETIRILKEHDPSGTIFTPEILEGVEKAIAATYPEVSFPQLSEEQVQIQDPENPEKKIDLTPYLGKDKEGKFNRTAIKFSQKYLTPESSLATLSLALGDLSYVGRVSPEEFAKEGDAEFRELNEGVKEDFKKGLETLEPKRKVEIANKMLTWQKTQIAFGLTQKIRFGEIIPQAQCLNDAEKTKLLELYNKFDTNMIAAKNRFDASLGNKSEGKYAALLNPETFETPEGDKLLQELAQDMGYPSFEKSATV